MSPEYSLSSKSQNHRAGAGDGHPLLPGLPDDIAHLCLSLVPPSTLRAVSRSWRRLLYSPSFPPFLSLYAILLSPEKLELSSPVHFYSFDPISAKWLPIPTPPPGNPLRLLRRHPSFIAHRFPVQSVSVSGNLALLAAADDEFRPALTQPLVFNPISMEWSRGPPMSAPRRWCAAGASGGSVYVASGFGSRFNRDVARAVERWDVGSDRRRWEEMAKLRDVKLCREAIDAVGWRGKLCMVNVTAKEGAVYDVGRDEWESMPEGMLAGWRGPAAAMAEETLYVVDESKGCLKEYDHLRDTWAEVVSDDMLKGAEQAAAAGGKVCVLCEGGTEIAVVDVAATRVWVVEVPPGFEAVGIHVLPRMCRTF